jgi:hypothetical protein
MDDKRLQEVLEQVRTSRQEAEDFVSDPQAYLQRKGVDTSGLRLAQHASGELSDADLDVVAGGIGPCCPPICSEDGVCVSVGAET